MESPIVTFEQLCEISGYTRPADVVVWLCENEVPYLLGKFKRPTTSTASLNAALGLPRPKVEKESNSLELIRATRYRFQLSHLDSTPDGKCHELYRYFDVKNSLLYVGISASAVRRYEGHKKKKSWTQRVNRIEIRRFPNRSYLLGMEAEVIRTEKPEYNIIHNEFVLAERKKRGLMQ